MEIPSHELQAFRVLAQVLNFSLAAERVHITQSALSQRIQSLERRLGLTLFVRDRKALRLTEGGIRLLRYCQTKDHLEEELLNDLAAPKGKLGGHLRIAAFSSVLHSVLMPALAPLLRANPAIRFDFSMHEMHELPDVLLRGEADFVVMDHVHEKNNLEAHLLGHESYVLLQSSRFPVTDVYLDHDPDDAFTKLFFKHQRKTKINIERCYVDDIEGVLQGIALGIGQGIVPQHLLRKNFPVRVVEGIKPMMIPVVLHYFQQAYYSRLQTAVVETLLSECRGFLGSSSIG